MRHFVLFILVFYAALLCVACTRIHVQVHQLPVPADVENLEDENIPEVIDKLPKRPLRSESQAARFVAHSTDQSCPGAKRKSDVNWQETDSWCWIASAQVVMKAHDMGLQQCDIASNVPSGNDPKDCCSWSERDEYKCSRNGRPEKVFKAYEFPYKVITRPLEPDEISWQLCNNGPFIFLLLFEGGGGHSYVVSDYDTDGSEMYLWIIDHQSNKKKRWSYDQFMTGAVAAGVNHKHDWDYVCLGEECPL